MSTAYRRLTELTYSNRFQYKQWKESTSVQSWVKQGDFICFIFFIFIHCAMHHYMFPGCRTYDLCIVNATHYQLIYEIWTHTGMVHKVLHLSFCFSITVKPKFAKSLCTFICAKTHPCVCNLCFFLHSSISSNLDLLNRLSFSAIIGPTGPSQQSITQSCIHIFKLASGFIERFVPSPPSFHSASPVLSIIHAPPKKP